MSVVNSRSIQTEIKYNEFQEWLNDCPIDITDYQDYTDSFEIKFTLPKESN